MKTHDRGDDPLDSCHFASRVKGHYILHKFHVEGHEDRIFPTLGDAMRYAERLRPKRRLPSPDGPEVA